MSLTSRERKTIERTYLREIDLKDWDARVEYAREISRLMRMSRKLDRINEVECNEPDEKIREIAKKQRARLESRAREICGRLNITLHVNQDPRGPALKINLNEAKHCSSSDDVDFLGMDTDLLYAVRSK
tara:strand:- start:2423 stop:2809 length:387 start_codon:yes stop_codon:yes gene_type:complete